MRGCLTICLLAALLTLPACTVVRALQGEPGTDVSGVRSGVTREVVEERLGQPRREWTTAKGVRYRIYAYDGGAPANSSDAAAFLFFDIVSFGLFEVFAPLDQDSFRVRHKEVQLAVAYDREDRVLGVFDDVGDFDILPDDGLGHGTAKSRP